MENTTVPLDFKFWVEGVTMPLLEALGTFGNLLAIAVLVSKEYRVARSLRHLAILLAAFDTLILICFFIFSCPGKWNSYYRCHFE